MSGHGEREARLRVDALAWRDRVIDDVLRGKGYQAAARGHIERYGDRELIRPVAVRAGELPFASQPKHGVLAVTVAWAAN